MTISQAVNFFNLKNFPNISILSSKQYVQMMPFCMYYRKYSCLLKPFDDQLNLFSSNGLIAIWERNFKITFLMKVGQKGPKPLSLDQITGVIIVGICLITASLIVFIFELMSTRHEAIKSFLDFLTYKTRDKCSHWMVNVSTNRIAANQMTRPINSNHLTLLRQVIWLWINQ